MNDLGAAFTGLSLVILIATFWLWYGIYSVTVILTDRISDAKIDTLAAIRETRAAIRQSTAEIKNSIFAVNLELSNARDAFLALERRLARKGSK